LPLMGDRAGWVEVLGAAAFALIVPPAISVLWRRLWPAGAIAGVALAFLLQVTAVVLALDAAVPGGRNGDLRSRGAAAPDVREKLQRSALAPLVRDG
jgi:hypothetical protein